VATFVKETQFVVETCCNCGVEFAMTQRLYQECQDGGPNRSFYCPNGHGQHYRKSTEQKLREELASAKQSLKWAQDSTRRAEQDAEHFKRSRDAYKGQTTKLKKQAIAGKCPCCERKFPRLAEHMAKEHPDFVNEEPS
jgi:hypothetical protein